MDNHFIFQITKYTCEIKIDFDEGTEYCVKFYIENIVLRISCGNTGKYK